MNYSTGVKLTRLQADWKTSATGHNNHWLPCKVINKNWNA